jgi:hypothetical protein
MLRFMKRITNLLGAIEQGDPPAAAAPRPLMYDELRGPMAVEPVRAKSLFPAASDLASPAGRAAYLDRECGEGAELRARVEALLAAHHGSGTVDAEPTSTPTEAATGASLRERLMAMAKIGHPSKKGLKCAGESLNSPPSGSRTRTIGIDGLLRP